MDIQKYRSGAMRPFHDFFDSDDLFNNNWLNRYANLPAVNIAESDKDFMIDLAAPGFKKEDFKIKVDEGVITISAESKSENKEEKKEYTRQEYNYSSFTRSFRLPENVKEDNIQAKYEDGMLKLSLPKSKTETKVTKEIRVS